MLKYSHTEILELIRIFILTVGICMAVEVPTEKIKDLRAPRIDRCIGSADLIISAMAVLMPQAFSPSQPLGGGEILSNLFVVGEIQFPNILCNQTLSLRYRFCCAIPPFFTQTVARQCGGLSKPFLMTQNVTGILRQLNDCSYWYCTLNKYDLITSKGFVDLDKYFIHLDLWTHLNTEFSDHIIDAKVSCKQRNRFHLPLRPCEFFKMNECVRNYLKVKCSHPFPTKDCLQQKKFFDECGDYFI